MTSSSSHRSSKKQPQSPPKPIKKPSAVTYKQTARIKVMNPVLATGGRQLAKPSPRQLAQLKPARKAMKRTTCTLKKKKKKQNWTSSDDETSDDDDDDESSKEGDKKSKKEVEKDIFGDDFYDDEDPEEDPEEDESEDEGFVRDNFWIDESDEEERGDQDRRSPHRSESFAGSSNRDYIAGDDGDDDDY